MRDLPAILGGLAAFVAAVTLPFWYNAIKQAPRRLNLPRPAAASQCIAPPDVMRRSHMEMLNAWRDRRVRDGVRTATGMDGQVYTIALTHTCLEQCHGSKAEFCDRCHAYVGLKGPDCWSCHNAGRPSVAGLRASRPAAKRSAR